MESQDFNFPFTPYDIQTRFMRELYSVIENKKIGIFESPTGTGKSLSLACGALTWLVNYEHSIKERLKDLKKSAADNASCTDWLAGLEKQMEHRDEEKTLADEIHDLEIISERLRNEKENVANNLIENKRKRRAENHQDQNDNNLNVPEDLILDDQIGESEQMKNKAPDDEKVAEEKSASCRKIFYASRTHSQLSQFLMEVKKTKYASTLRAVVLGSRQSYCINESVRSLKSSGLINDRCLELQKNSGSQKAAKVQTNGDDKIKKRKGASCCQNYRPSMFDSAGDRILLETQTADEVVKWCREEQICPYYASRRAVSAAQLVLLPYQMLLHEGTRRASGIELEGNVVIIDEAHNLLDAIASVHSSELTQNQVQTSLSQLLAYLDRYRERLSPQNLSNVRDLVQLLKCLEAIMSKSASGQSQMYSHADFIFKADLVHFNFYRILEFAKQSQIAKKLRGFAMQNGSNSAVTVTPRPQKTGLGIKAAFGKNLTPKSSPATKVESSESKPRTTTSLYQVLSFLESLTVPVSDGRILLNRENENSSLRFLLLNPGAHFAGVVKSARSVVLAGGTMKPCGELESSLKVSCEIPAERIHWFSCGHVIDKDNLLPIALGVGPSGNLARLDYNNRRNTSTIDDLGACILNLARIVPGGVVVFCVSYDYLNTVLIRLRSSGTFDKITDQKRVFTEPKSASEVDQVLTNYQRGIRNQVGSVLFAVIGGKMSEGINFADEMGRCVLVAGLPYPNRSSPQLQEKLRFLEQNPQLGQSSSEFYESLCMKAVNQSIGRAIRHQNDYAMIILYDERYLESRIQSKLPAWISKSLISQNKSFGHVIGAARHFFRLHQTN